jgi:SAM-dependent methyltransferase
MTNKISLKNNIYYKYYRMVNKNELKDYIHGSIEEQLAPEIKKNVNKIFDKIGKNDEFEFMFFNYKRGENLMGFENFLKILNYINYKSRAHKLRIEKEITLDISYQPEGRKMGSYRITVLGLESINKVLSMLHIRKNHVIFSTLVNMIKHDKNITIMEKIKDMENVHDINDYDIRVRMSKEMDVSEKAIKQLSSLKETEQHLIMFRYKQRVSLYVLDEKDSTVKIDLTNVKMDKNIRRIHKAIPNYELEIDYMSTKPNSKHLSKMFGESTTILKILQQSNFIMNKTLEDQILGKYADLLGENREKMMSLAGRKAQSLEVQHVVDKLPNKYAVTDKADGERCFLIIYNGVAFIISDNLHVRNTGYFIPPNQSKFNDTILDGELIFLPEKNRYIFMVFDCLFSQGKDVRQDTVFMDRIAEADKVIKNCFVLKDHRGYDIKKYNGKFDLNKISEHHENEIDNFMSALNHDINVESKFVLIRRKYFAFVDGAKDNEIFKFSKILWDKYVFDKKTNCPYILDGLIYHPLEQKYVTSVKESKFIEYKWKPPTKNSVDFYLEFEKDRDTGKILVLFDNSNENTVKGKPYKVARLHVGSRGRTGEIPVPFLPDQNKHISHLYLHDGDVRDIEGNIIQDKTVVEFYYNNDPDVPTYSRWVPMRTRHDKTESIVRYGRKYGNYIDVAKKVWRSIKNPFTMYDIGILINDATYHKHIDVLRGKIDHSIILSQAKEDVYYQIRTNLGKPMRNFHNWIKSILIYTHCNPVYEKAKSQTILDMGCGRGGDNMKFYYAKVDLYVGIDVDNNGLISPADGAISRYNQLRKTHRNFPQMFFINADGGALLDYDEQIKVLGTMSRANENMMKKFFSLKSSERTMFDRINCQFAMHYFLANETTWNNFLQNVNMYLKPGGFMIVTTFDGQRVANILKDKPQHTAYYTNDKGEKKSIFEVVKKYNIEDPSKVFGVGHAIDVYNGLISNEGIYNTEYLVDKRFVEKEFLEKCSMELVETDLFENQFNIHKEFFTNSIKHEENPKTKQFFMKVAEFYNQENEVNRACFEMSRINRFYVFRKKDDASVGMTKGKKQDQQGGNNYVDYVMMDALEYINPKKYVRRELETNDEFSFCRAVHDVLQTDNIIPKTLPYDVFYEDIDLKTFTDLKVNKTNVKKLTKSLVIGYHGEKKMNGGSEENKVSLNGCNIVVLEKDCDGTNVVTYSKGTHPNRRDPTIILYYDGSRYNPIYRSRDGQNYGLFDSRMKFIGKILSESD